MSFTNIGNKAYLTTQQLMMLDLNPSHLAALCFRDSHTVARRMYVFNTNKLHANYYY